MTMGLLHRKPKTTAELREDIDHRANIFQAYRLAEEAQGLAAQLRRKAGQLKEEIDRGRPEADQEGGASPEPRTGQDPGTGRG